MSITLRSEVLKKYPNPVFLETGTFKGGGVKLALGCGFPKVVSIEIDPPLVQAAREMFKDTANVNIVLGDSLEVLPELLSFIQDPITFWLDAHIQESCVLGKFPVPLIEELSIIAQSRGGAFNDTVLIDVRRLFGQGAYRVIVTGKQIGRAHV